MRILGRSEAPSRLDQAQIFIDSHQRPSTVGNCKDHVSHHHRSPCVNACCDSAEEHVQLVLSIGVGEQLRQRHLAEASKVFSASTTEKRMEMVVDALFTRWASASTTDRSNSTGLHARPSTSLSPRTPCLDTHHIHHILLSLKRNILKVAAVLAYLWLRWGFPVLFRPVFLGTRLGTNNLLLGLDLLRLSGDGGNSRLRRLHEGSYYRGLASIVLFSRSTYIGLGGQGQDTRNRLSMRMRTSINRVSVRSRLS